MRSTDCISLYTCLLLDWELTLLSRWMERSMMSEPATRRVSTVATDHVGVSASDRISPSPVTAAAAVPSPPAIFLSKDAPGARSLLLLRNNRPSASHCRQCHGS